MLKYGSKLTDQFNTCKRAGVSINLFYEFTKDDMAHILIIDDSELALEFTRMMLEADDHSVVTTSDPTEFMQIVHTGQPRPQLLIVDAVMPEVSGLDLIHQIRANPDPLLANLPILLATALEGQALSDEGVLVLTKPFGMEELQQALNMALS